MDLGSGLCHLAMYVLYTCMCSYSTAHEQLVGPHVSTDSIATRVCVFSNSRVRAYIHASTCELHALAHSVRCKSNTCALPKLMRLTHTHSGWLFFLRFSYYM